MKSVRAAGASAALFHCGVAVRDRKARSVRRWRGRRLLQDHGFISGFEAISRSAVQLRSSAPYFQEFSLRPSALYSTSDFSSNIRIASYPRNGTCVCVVTVVPSGLWIRWIVERSSGHLKSDVVVHDVSVVRFVVGFHQLDHVASGVKM